MFCITVDDLSGNDSLPIYELPKGATVLDLKREIEASADIATCFQSFIYNGRPLTADDEKLDSIIVGDPSDVTIYLHAQGAQALFRNRSSTKPDCATQKPSTVKVQAEYDWDGDVKYSSVKGLLLKSGQKYYVINKGLPEHSEWYYGSTSLKNPFLPYTPNISEGYFPKNYVSEIKNTIANAKISPPIPFRPPSAIASDVKFNILDGGHTFLHFTAKYDLESSPYDPTHVTISLTCHTFDSRRFSAIGVNIEVPGSRPLQAKVCELEAHGQTIQTEVEMSDTRTRQKGVDGFSLAAHGITAQVQGGVSTGKKIKISERGERVSAVKPEPYVDIDGNIIRWSLKAPTLIAAPEGICGTESITCTLTNRPVHFKYLCRVQHIKKGVEKTEVWKSRY